MSSFVFMRVLESAPERYDAGIRLLSRGRIEAVYVTIADLVARPGRRILDVGCGTGGVTIACAARGADVVGIDINAGMLEVAAAKIAARDRGSHPGGRIELLKLGAIEIEDRFDDESFDAVVSCLTFSELSPAERSYALTVIYSRLKPGGQLVIADELMPPTKTGRLLHKLRRLPLAMATYALTQTTTRPVEKLDASVQKAGFKKIATSSPWSGSFQILSAVKPENEP